MIKVERIAPPKELDNRRIQKLTNEYAENKSKRVWGKSFIKDQLLLMSHGKCVFCETELVERGKFMEVEHFHPKSLYPSEVVSWENLLPCCSECNRNKGKHDTKLEPIVNPTIDDPKSFLLFKNYRLKGKNEVGKRTIELLQLNSISRLSLMRYGIAEALREKLGDLLDKSRECYLQNGSQLLQTKIFNTARDLLDEAQPNKPYSATVATILMQEDEYGELKETLKMLDIWNDELEKLDSKVKELALDC
ncbi:HNH endonuclease [Enterococcus larvae]|uniref:HNH endonuclease n=1 Tax=Enterococcus larvae TaxID=2794352 RepID=UPI003F33A4E1